MADLRIQFNEEMVGTGHPVKADTLNRLSLVEHNNDGTHKYNLTGRKELDLREFLPVGFVTNGSVDYSDEIQECITNGQRIYLPAGIWLCENLNVRGYRNIRGAGRANTILKIPASSASWLINSSDGATGDWLPYSSITDLSIDGSSSTTALGGIYAKFVTQWLFERITMYGFYNPAAVGLWLNHAYQIAMRDCYIRMGSAGAGKKGEACFKVGATTADPVHTTHITYDNCLAQYSGTGFLLAAMGNRGGNMTIRECAAGNHDYGVRIQDFYREVLVENSLIENTSINGVRVTTATSYNIHNVRLEELTMYENTTAVFANNVDGLGMDKLRLVGDDEGGHTAFNLSGIKRLELGTYNVENTAYDTIVAAGTVDPRMPNLALDDATPSVAVGGKRHSFKTQSVNPTTITAFDDGVVGQEITVIFADANTTIDFTGTNLKGNGGVDFAGAAGDVMTGIFDGTNWYFQVHDNTP
ncbi:MAG: hypothetical protein HYV23_08675 [Deltaproteobacteria bacterium]|nr:hypothetical protein [Deltaproteobacteria bacterium]